MKFSRELISFQNKKIFKIFNLEIIKLFHNFVTQKVVFFFKNKMNYNGGTNGGNGGNGNGGVIIICVFAALVLLGLFDLSFENFIE